MANPPRKKGTKGEGEVKNGANTWGLTAVRTAAGTNYDVRLGLGGSDATTVIHALLTRPDRGRWLATIDYEELLRLIAAGPGNGIHGELEVKRYKRFAHHTIYEQKFGRQS